MNLTLTERRAAVRKLPRAVAAELAEKFPHAVEVVPTFDRRRYRLTAKGYVGWVRVQGVTVTFRPKRPWAEVRALFSPSPLRGGGRGVGSSEHPPSPDPSPDPRSRVGLTVGGEGSLLDLLAARLSSLMLDRASAGLLCGYVERELTDAPLRGRIDLPRQLRKPTARPTLFDQVADEWTPDVPWNRLAKAAAVRLLAEPGLGPAERDGLG